MNAKILFGLLLSHKSDQLWATNGRILFLPKFDFFAPLNGVKVKALI